MTKTLEGLLRERLADSRAMTAVLDINADRIFLRFGHIGPLLGITLMIRGNEAVPVTPEALKAAWEEEDAGKRSRTPLDPAKPLAAVFEGGRLYACEGGPEIDLPENFFEYVATELLASDDEDKDGEKEPESPAGEGDGNGGDDDAGEGPKAINPDEHLKAELIEIAKAEGVEIDANATKAAIAEAINAKRAAPPAGAA
ncbi:hypothetical protein [Microcystis phage Mae-JY30]